MTKRAFCQRSVLVLVCVLSLLVPRQALAQSDGEATETPQSIAPIDLTGYWVSIVNEDWRWRMLTPPPGDFESVPLNDEGERVGNEWIAGMDGQCEAFGVGGLMRMPGRLNITWQDEQTLRVETDAGSQVRILNFAPDEPGPPSLQGYSVARWDSVAAVGGRAFGFGGLRGFGGRRGGNDRSTASYLRVDTSNVTAAWLRRNGAPYSQDATITEYIDRFTSSIGEDWLTVLTIVIDPMYLSEPFVTSTQFKRELDESKWMPTTCR
jgi:hypothetical protein